MIRLGALGGKAEAALARSGGAVRRYAALSASIYVTAADELLWLGPRGGTLHPRAMLAVEPFTLDDGIAWIDTASALSWRPERLPIDERAPATAMSGCLALRAAAKEIGTPTGFGVLLLGSEEGAAFVTVGDAFVERGSPPARALGRACRTHDARSALDAATELLGLGPGLTPAGDDFVGGALFAHALFSHTRETRGRDWDRATAEIVRRARARTHPISAALLGDLVAGEGFAPLHDLARALAVGSPADTLDAACQLVSIGHSSGWDLLAGFVAGLAEI